MGINFIQIRDYIYLYLLREERTSVFNFSTGWYEPVETKQRLMSERIDDAQELLGWVGDREHPFIRYRNENR